MGKQTRVEQLPSTPVATAKPAAASAGGPAPQPILPSSEAWHAPSSTRHPDAPPSRNADWAQVQGATTDDHAQEALDIAWVESLPVHLRNTIDEAFSDHAATAAVSRAVPGDAGLKEIARDIDQQESVLRADAVERLAQQDPALRRLRGKALEAKLNADSRYSAALAQLESQRKRRIEDRKRELQIAADGPMADPEPREDTVAKPPTRTITRLEGKALARTNFVSWAIDVLGSAEAAKRHFQSMREVTRQPGMFLIDTAATRFEAARAEFETAHPGYTFPSTDVGQDLRKFHHARQGIGMLGHALGVAFDLWAYDNPNQKIGKTDNFGYALERFGGTNGARGRSVMELGAGADGAIAQLGRDTAAGRSTPDGQAMTAKVHDQFLEMVATSEQLRASMEAHLPEFEAARDDYFNAKELQAQLDQATKDETDEAKIARRMKAEKFSGDDAAKAARRAEIRLELHSKKEALAQALKRTKDRIPRELNEAFAEWTAMIDADLEKVNERKATSDTEVAARANARQELDALDPRAPGAIDAMNAFADKYQLRKRAPAPPAAMYKQILKAALAAKQKPRGETDPLSPAYIKRELAVLGTWKARLHDPAFVFGRGFVVPSAAATTNAAATAPATNAATTAPATNAAGTAPTTNAAATAPTTNAAATAPTTNASTPTTSTTAAAVATVPAAKHWGSKTAVSDAPLAQYIEHGFIRNDAMPDRSGARDKKQAFNAEVAATLARYGFSPGATYRDTMHFDFIEGYNAAPGGRSQANMATNKYGPTGDVVPPSPKAKSAPKKDHQ